MNIDCYGEEFVGLGIKVVSGPVDNEDIAPRMYDYVRIWNRYIWGEDGEEWQEFQSYEEIKHPYDIV